MVLLEILVVAVVLFGVAAVAAGHGDPMSAAPVDGSRVGLPSGRLAASDLPRIRFAMAVRGYRMSEVDEVLDRLTGELAARDDELARLQAERGSTEG